MCSVSRLYKVTTYMFTYEFDEEKEILLSLYQTTRVGRTVTTFRKILG